MKKFLVLIVCIALSAWNVAAQNLLPSINSGILPSNNDPVCSTPWLSNVNYDSTGYLVGDTVNDFTLFDRNSNGFQLSTALSQGKPVLLIAGSVTCPIFRSQIQQINFITSVYSAYISTAVVYVIEPHPTDTSPYSGTVNVTSYNINQNIFYPQPDTYLDRKNLVDTLFDNYTVNFPVYLDGPCNEWWNTYGPAPLNAYLIDTNGVVIMKQGWFNQYPNNIYCDLDQALNISLPYCAASSPNGSFTMYPLTTVVSGTPGQTLYTTADIVNNSLEDVIVEVIKVQEIYPQGWNSAFCMGICYAQSTDSTNILIHAGDTVHFSLDFFTSAIPDSARVRVNFRNASAPNNTMGQWFRAYTTPTAITENTGSDHGFRIYPNPATERIEIISNDSAAAQFVIYDAQGRMVQTGQRISGRSQFNIDISALPSGFYFLAMQNDKGTAVQKFVRQ